MSVLIKGMEMPTSCIACLLNFGEKRPEYGLTIFCPYSDGVISWRDKAFDNGRLASCGIVHVPPHGRLIDADVQDAQIEALIERHLHGYTKSTWDFVCELRDILKRNRTIIPAEPSEEQREYEVSVEAAQYCEMYEPTYDPGTGAM